MKLKALLLLFTFCQLAYARIGTSLATSQAEYGSPGARNENGVEWHYKGWHIVEHYDSGGFCDCVCYYPPADFSDETLTELLRMNTPPGVTWTREPDLKWYSSQYQKPGAAGVILDSLVAQEFPQFKVTGGHMTMLNMALRIATVSFERNYVPRNYLPSSQGKP